MKLINVDIYFLVPFIIIENKANLIIAKKQRSIQLECSYTGGKPKPSVTWFFEGITLDLIGDKYQQNDNILVINDLNRNDSGIYTCALNNGYHPLQEYNYTVFVYGMLSIINVFMK